MNGSFLTSTFVRLSEQKERAHKTHINDTCNALFNKVLVIQFMVFRHVLQKKERKEERGERNKVIEREREKQSDR